MFKAAAPSSSAGGNIRFRRGLARAALLYALAIAYVSLVLGPDGFNFVPLTVEDAWKAFLAMPYFANDSDQRADWVSNLLMLVPLGFTLAGALWPSERSALRLMSAAGTLAGCGVFVLAVKFAQLYFPPRTVSLNYVIAQFIGSLAGVILYWATDRVAGRFAGRYEVSWRNALMGALAVYSAALVLFWMFPLDFVVSGADLRARIGELPDILLSWPGEGRPIFHRIILVIAGALISVPIGMLLVVGGCRSAGRLLAAGFMIVTAAFVPTLFVMNAAPSLWAIAYRTAAVCAGGAVMVQLERADLARLRSAAARFVAPAVLPYLALVIYVNGLITPQWLTPREALSTLDVNGLLPFYHYYIVSKAHALQSAVVHAATFAPIGVMIWLRFDNRGGSAAWAAALGLLFSLAIEIGRWFKPGLQPDFSDCIVAAAAAALSVKALPYLWTMLESAADAAPRASKAGVSRLPAEPRPSMARRGTRPDIR